MGDNMHTPDGLLTSWICYLCIGIAISAIAYSVYKLKDTSRQAAMQMAGLAAIIFAMQMLNFPISKGTSGHMIGASLAAIMFGPYAAILIISSVLGIQAIAFGDGGVLTLGANILMIGIVASFTANYVYTKLKKTMIAAIAASWASVVAAAGTASLLLGMSSTIDYSLVFPAMLLTHAVIGVGEGIITIGIRYFYTDAKSVAIAVAGAFLIMSLALPIASQSPDGLEKVAINLGFYENAVEIYSAPFTLSGAYLASMGAAAVGMLAVFGAAYLMIGKSFLTRPA
jgi:cobalt/nickel transport system permease protein